MDKNIEQSVKATNSKSKCLKKEEKTVVLRTVKCESLRR